jgi:hypothetical protein
MEEKAQGVHNLTDSWEAIRGRNIARGSLRGFAVFCKHVTAHVRAVLFQEIRLVSVANLNFSRAFGSTPKAVLRDTFEHIRALHIYIDAVEQTDSISLITHHIPRIKHFDLQISGERAVDSRNWAPEPRVTGGLANLPEGLISFSLCIGNHRWRGFSAFINNFLGDHPNLRSVRLDFAQEALSLTNIPKRLRHMSLPEQCTLTIGGDIALPLETLAIARDAHKVGYSTWEHAAADGGMLHWVQTAADLKDLKALAIHASGMTWRRFRKWCLRFENLQVLSLACHKWSDLPDIPGNVPGLAEAIAHGGVIGWERWNSTANIPAVDLAIVRTLLGVRDLLEQGNLPHLESLELLGSNSYVRGGKSDARHATSFLAYMLEELGRVAPQLVTLILHWPCTRCGPLTFRKRGAGGVWTTTTPIVNVGDAELFQPLSVALSSDDAWELASQRAHFSRYFSERTAEGTLFLRGVWEARHDGSWCAGFLDD